MTRFEEKSPQLLVWSIWITTALVFLSDHLTPYGISVYMGYMVPMALSFFLWRSKYPLWMAMVGTILIVAAYFTTPDGLGRELSEYRRLVAVLTLWMLAVIGHQYIRSRLVTRRESWLQTGQASLTSKLMGELELAVLAENVLGFLTAYLNAQAGAMFVEDEGKFMLAGTYATSEDSVPKRFSPGEGLLGQAVKTTRNVTIDNVPDGYMMIGSSLGKSLPRHLLIVPFSFDGKVNTVIELGFFHAIRKSDEALLSRVESAVAVAVRSVKYRLRLQELMEETQLQSEEVQAQSEELRVSNEELEEQGRALRESQARLELQHAELEQINMQLEVQTKVLEQQKDSLAAVKVNLEKKAQEVELASRYKSDFLANMSHELRTPLNSSLILAKLLAENRDAS